MSEPFDTEAHNDRMDYLRDIFDDEEMFQKWVASCRDTDGSPKGRDPQGLDGEAATAGAEGIARKDSPCK